MKLEALRKRYGLPSSGEPSREEEAGRSLPALSVPRLLDGQILPLGSTRSFSRELAYGAVDRHGPHSFQDLATLSGDLASAVTGDDELAYADLGRAVFLDTETTGLGMGVGTYVFLVGAGYFDGSHFRVRQFFLGSPGDENVFLHELGSFLAQFAAVVTFNGKAFDWPLLENRYVFHRRPAPLQDPPHFDLLHPARRLWKRRLSSCALGALERDILGLTRTEEDVPGWQIPALYFEYLRRGDGTALAGVFYHNLHDILSLASLAVHVQRIVQDPASGFVQDPIDCLSLGKVFERAGDPGQAAACYEEAVTRGIPPLWRRECLYSLAGVYKRQRLWDRALRVWEQMVDDGGAGAMLALVEIAKYHEHVERDYLQALDAVQQAITLIELPSMSDADVDVADLEHRRARLLNRVYRRRSWVGSAM